MLAAPLELEVESGSDSLAELRAAVGEWLADHHVAFRYRDDVLLVLNELVSNAFRHGENRVATVRLRLHPKPDRVEVTVANEAPPTAVPPPTAWRLPDGLSGTGRGLAIVAALGHRPEVDHRDGAVMVSTSIVLS